MHTTVHISTCKYQFFVYYGKWYGQTVVKQQAVPITLHNVYCANYLDCNINSYANNALRLKFRKAK